jgi:Family of unknown function (DUF5908)
MAVRINTILIKASIVEPAKEEKPNQKAKSISDTIDRTEIINEAVGQVFQILKFKKER